MAKGGEGLTIVKRKKIVGGDGHHGGAWKVAYADFVTAMMAFFLLMWLLNATTEEQRSGIADFFNPSIPLSRVSGGGNDLFNGSTQFEQDTLTASQNGADDTESATTAKEVVEGETVNGPADENLGPDGKVDSKRRDQENQAFAEIQRAIEAVSGESDVADELMRHIRTRVTDDGLVIEIFDKDGAPLFLSGSTEPSVKMRQLLSLVGSVIQVVDNELAIEGHTDATPYSGQGAYDNWELSSDRAHAARRVLLDEGLANGRMARVTGKAATQPMLENPYSAQNRRIAITLLRSDLRQ